MFRLFFHSITVLTVFNFFFASFAAKKEYGGLTFEEVQKLDTESISQMSPQQLAAVIAALEAGSRDSDNEEDTFQEEQDERRRIAAARRIQAAYRAYRQRKQQRFAKEEEVPAAKESFLGPNSSTYESHKRDHHAAKARWKPARETDEELTRSEVLFERAKKKWMEKNKKRGPGWEKTMLEELRSNFPKEVKRALKMAPKSKDRGRKSKRDRY